MNKEILVVDIIRYAVFAAIIILYHLFIMRRVMERQNLLSRLITNNIVRSVSTANKLDCMVMIQSELINYLCLTVYKETPDTVRVGVRRTIFDDRKEKETGEKGGTETTKHNAEGHNSVGS